LRTCYPQPTTAKKIAELDAKALDKKITIIGMEGLTFDFIIPLISEQKLPNFSWLMEEGSWGKLENFTPTELIILNRSFNTGKFPYKHGQVTREKCILLPLNMEILVIPRFILFKQMERIKLIKCLFHEAPKKTKDMWEILKNNNTPYLKKDNDYLKSDINKLSSNTKSLVDRFFEDIDFESDEILQIAKNAFASDAEFLKSVEQEAEKVKPKIVYILLRGINLVEKYFYKYSFPELFEEVSQEEINKYGPIMERYYQFYDEVIGKYLTAKKDNELLVVYSPHGIDYLPVWKRMVELVLGNPKISAYHENAPKGVVFFYGKGISPGKNIEDMKIIDMTPTFLHYLGLPLGKDMDGIVNSSIFKSSFNIENPVLYISSYEEVDIKPPQ
jgi:predicted AlkP superfamily phosphohydrolase/phosphomutase